MSSPTLNLLQAGPSPLPVTRGRLLDFPDDPLACMRALHERHGDIAALEEDGQRLYFVFSPEYNHQILSDGATYHSRFFAIRGARNSPQRRLTSGLLSMNGEQHKRNRRLVMDAFSRKAIQFYVPTILKLTDDMLAGWEPGRVLDVNQEMTEFLLRLVSSILFGVDRPEMAHLIGRMTEHWVHQNHEVGMGAFVSSPEITERYQDLLSYATDLEVELKALIDLRRTSQTMSHDALSMLLAAHDGQGSISDGELVGNTALLFAAAHLTTAHTLGWTLLLLSQHPSVMGRLHGEITENLAGEMPTPERIEKLPYLERVIKESMRCLPASSYSQRITSQPVTLGPFDLPAGACVIFSQFMTHHASRVYQDSYAFNPSRWETIAPSPYAYLPFGAGPRMCIGAALGMLMIKTILPTILQRFKLTMVPQAEVSGKIISTMLCPTTTIPMLVERQDGKFSAQPIGGNIHQMVDLRECPPQVVRRAA